MPQLWPLVKVADRSSSTIPQTHIFFVPNIKGLAQTVLTWEGKVFAAADADAAETDWKHKVTPERGDLIREAGLLSWHTAQVNSLTVAQTACSTGVSEWVIKFYSLSRTADSEVHLVHISRVIIACTLKSLSSPHIDNTQSTSYK